MRSGVTVRRTDIPAGLVLQHSAGARGTPIVSDRRFELDLAAAQALARFGIHEEAERLAQVHAKDERALVRSYARRVLAEVREPALT